MAAGKKIKVLVVDDSAVMRKLIPRLLDADSELEVIGTAIDGDFALNKIEQMKPDVITLDVDMPRMDGITALTEIVSKHRIPTLMLSSLTTRGASLPMKALEIGAVDFICKPSASARVEEMAGELIGKIKAAAGSKPVTHAAPPAMQSQSKKRAGHQNGFPGAEHIVAIGASSGGPHALRFLLPRLPADFGAGIVIVQHMPESFTSVMARWLDDICEIEVKEASEGDLIAPGRALIAPGNQHLRVRRSALGGVAMLQRSSPVNGHMPSVEVLFDSVAREYGKNSTGVILTGMGTDGAEAIGEIKKSGGLALAQDRDSCAVFGMPKAAIEKGNIDEIIPLTDLPSKLISAVGRCGSMEVTHDAEARRA